MRKLYTFGLSILLLSCLSETSVDPGSSFTFIRYYNGGNNDEAKALALASDGGYMLLATTSIKKKEADTLRTKIKVIKSDANGNPLWQKLYPGFTIKGRDYLASSIIPNTGGGYVIIGDVIDNSGVSKALVMTIDENGVPVDSIDIAFTPGIAEKGKAVAVDATGNIVALSTQGTSKMIITQIDKNTFLQTSQLEYAAGETNLTNKLYIDPAGKVVLSGSKTLGGLTGVRLLRTLPQSPTVDFDLFLNEPGFSLAGFDFCQYGQGYAIAGATNLKPDGSAAADTDVMFFLTDADGIKQRFTSFPFDDPATPENEDNQIDGGNAIAATQDGGLIFLASISSVAIEGRGDTEFYMIKINAFGEKEWTSSFGSRFKDEGVAIRQLTDGTYVALGTTTQGSLKILTLFRTDKNGKID